MPNLVEKEVLVKALIAETYHSMKDPAADVKTAFSFRISDNQLNALCESLGELPP